MSTWRTAQQQITGSPIGPCSVHTIGFDPGTKSEESILSVRCWGLCCRRRPTRMRIRVLLRFLNIHGAGCKMDSDHLTEVLAPRTKLILATNVSILLFEGIAIDRYLFSNPSRSTNGSLPILTFRPGDPHLADPGAVEFPPIGLALSSMPVKKIGQSQRPFCSSVPSPYSAGIRSGGPRLARLHAVDVGLPLQGARLPISADVGFSGRPPPGLCAFFQTSCERNA